MSKVFRLYNIHGDNTIVDWQESSVYGTQAISEITDPDGADARKEITSIPSPFARIDLVKTAFKEVVDMANKNPMDMGYSNFDGNTIYHKMVSDVFDVAEIFFKIENYRDKFDILVWDRARDLDMESVFGKTLHRYLEADAAGDDPYNFGQMKRIYLLNYRGPGRTAPLNIVGGTSPATLFFCSANDFSYIAEHISFGTDMPFDVEYQPLYRRDFELQKYFYAFRIVYGVGNFHRDFPEFDDYLISLTGQMCNYALLTQTQRNEIDRLDENSIARYEPIAVNDRAADIVDILGRHFHKKTNDGAVNNSHFKIQSDLYTGNEEPLVLPVEAGSRYANMQYTTDIWGRESRAPYFDPAPWQNRRLPIVSDSYPYLTISDFLTDTIVRMPYNLNSESFFNGHYNNNRNEESVSYLLPLTNTFFQFFTVEHLQGTIPNTDKKMFELQAVAGGNVTAILRIPVENGCIEYRRTYFEGSQANIEQNDGGLIEKKIGMGIMPLISFPENVNKHYRIALFDKGQNDISLTCYKGNDSIQEIAHIVRKRKDLDDNTCSIESYVITENFDRIDVIVGDNIRGVIVPKFRITNGNRIYTFAVDFGTTNTHIEYSFVTNEDAQNTVVDPFKISMREKQLHRLHTLYAADRDIDKAFEHNFIPDTIADNDDYQFPMRTVFSEWNENNRQQTIYALANGNIPFLYEKDMFPERYNNVHTELKWRGENDYPLVRLYMENIFLLLRNKVVLNGGNLEATKIIWFYPASMDTGRCDAFNEIWTRLYNEYFGNNSNTNLITISESAAPYRYYRRRLGAKSEVVTIDVGGGTTDVYVVENDQPKMLLSFRFASNAIFGDAFNWDSENNGFIKLYCDEFAQILEGCGQGELVSTLRQIKVRRNSSDIIAFLFSLVTNPRVRENEALNLLFRLSQNKKMKYVFILFYGAIFYFIARSMKTKGLRQPLTLAFSGNGSKTLRILSSNNNTISRFVKLIFDGVYEQQGNRLDIIFEDEPKKATCKGGILNQNRQTPDDIRPINFTLIGDDLNRETTERVTFADITEDIQNQITDSVIEFVDFLFELHDNNDEFFVRSLGADENIIEQVKEICRDRVELSQSLNSALIQKRGDRVIEETLFFYPLIGVLHELARELANGTREINEM